MMVIKSLLLAGFMLVSALAEGSSKPSMATMEVRSNFDFSLTRREFRVYYSGIGDGIADSETGAKIKIYKKDTQEILHEFDVVDKNNKQIYQFALEDTKDDSTYEVQVCSGETCSDRNPALKEAIPPNEMKITCKRIILQEDQTTKETETPFELSFFGPEEGDLIKTEEYDGIEQKVNDALKAFNKPANYKTDYKRLELSANPQYKHHGNIFYVAVHYDIKRFKKLFDRMPTKNAKVGEEYAHEFCERKYLLSAHAHVVKTDTKEVLHRFKTTLFLSEGGKQMYVLNKDAGRVHVELAHEGESIDEGNYDLWITFCATEKDAIESTFCAAPIIRKGFAVTHD